MKCNDCGAKTIGWIITVRGGSRVRSIAGLRSRGVKCERCADERIAKVRAAEVRKTGATR